MKTTIIALISTVTCMASSAMAGSSLLLDFGPTSNGNPEDSPSYVIGGLTDNDWNILGTADVSSGLRFADSTAATGIALDLGVGNDLSSVDFTTNPTNSNGLGAAVGGLIYKYANNQNKTPAAKDAIYGTTNVVAAQITGLSAGTYDIYVTARNTNIGSDASQFAVDTGTAASSFDFSSAALAGMSNADAFPNVWTAAENYNVIRTTLASGDALFVAVNGAVGNDTRGFMNSIAVVSVPESSHVPMWLATGTLLIMFGINLRRRFRR